MNSNTKIITFGVLVLSLFVIILLFLVKDLLVYNMAQTYKEALHRAENDEAFCKDDNPLCIWEPNDTLGTPVGSIDTFSRQNALIIADLIGRVEHAAKNKTGITSPPNFELINSITPSTGPVFTGIWKTVETKDNQQIKTLYIMFRGTMTSEEWQRDLQTSQQNVTPGELKTNKYTQLQDTWYGHAKLENKSEEVKVHHGFLEMFKEVQSQINNVILAENPNFTYIAGHSLGAAVATLAGLQFFDITNLVVYTIASPRVGNIAFAQAVQSNYVLFRISNQSDLVNDIPLAVMFNLYGDHEPYVYDHAGTNFTFNNNWGSWKNNHYLAIYINCLDNPECLLTQVDWS